MEKYTINYQNGFTNEFSGTLEEAKLEALDGMSYTQAHDNNAVLEEIGGGFYGDWE
ncbi:MAG TPA: hypothetical protein VIR26_05565 [Metalysinibacillus sp.]